MDIIPENFFIKKGCYLKQKIGQMKPDFFGAQRGIRTPVARRAIDLQSTAIDRSAICACVPMIIEKLIYYKQVTLFNYYFII